MKIVILDAQGGGIGKQIVSALKKRYPEQYITAESAADCGGDERAGDGSDAPRGGRPSGDGRKRRRGMRRDGGFDSLPDWHGAVRRDAGRSDREHGAGGRAQQGAQDSAAGEQMPSHGCGNSKNEYGRSRCQGGGRNRGAGFGGFRLKRIDLFVTQGFRLCGGEQRAMKTDEVCDRPLETFGFASHVTGRWR